MLDRILEAGEPRLGDEKELKAVLGNESLLRRLHSVLSEASAKDSLVMVDLSKGLEAVAEKRGEVRGLRRAVDIIIEGLEDG